MSAHIKVRDIADLFQNAPDLVHHLAVVYGNHAAEVKELGGIMGFDVVEA